MADKLNLDASVQREDFEIGTAGGQTQTIQVRDLERGAFFFDVIGKPDFQRETADWNQGRITDLVRSFIDGDLILALILWNSGGNIFVIDGAHRLSALIALVNDDYGDGVLSCEFSAGRIPDDQINLAEKTRRRIKREMGSYEEHRFAIQKPTEGRGGRC